MKFYFVKLGDTLSSIASLYDTTVEEILQINDIENPDLIYPNQAVLVPQSARLCPFPHREVVIRRKEEVDNIVALNRISNPNPIYSNQVLLVTAIEPAATATPMSVPTKKYEVQVGDTLFNIAQNFNTAVGTLVSLNNITDPDLIYPGREILVPDITI